MAEKQLKTTIILRNDTAENWVAKDPVLKQGEAAVDNSSRKIKVGDGTSKWSELGYVGGDEAKNFVVTPNEGESDIDAITRVVGATELHSGDTAIVKRVITGDKISYTAYVYDGAWRAMDGNYNASNVYFDKDLTYTVAIGTLAKPSGSATFASTGKSVEQMFASLMAKEENPNKTLPAVSFTKQTGFGTVEIGTRRNLDYTVALSTGSYTYGPVTGITAQSWSVTCTGVADPKTTATGIFENVVAEASAKRITAVAQYNEGAIPVTNLGNEYPDGQIQAGSATNNSSALIGVRHMFYGPLTTDAELTSAVIRGLNHEAAAKKTIATFGAGANAKKVVVACPAGYNVTKVLMPSAMNADATANFVKQTAQVQVEGAEGYQAVAYDVWVYQPASIDSTETYAVTIG